MDNVQEEVVKTTQELLNEAQARILHLQGELDRTDYQPIKASEGEDMTQYGDWIAIRKAQRIEIGELEVEVLRLRELLKKEAEEVLSNEPN